LTIAITGFPNWSSFMPLARHRARAPAMFLPVVVFELLKLIFVFMLQKYVKKKLSG